MGIFIIGILFGVFLIPIITDFSTVISQVFQVLIYKMEVSITKSKVKIQNLSKEVSEEGESNPIGFQTEAIGYEIPSEEYYYEDDDDDCCKKR